MVGSCVEPQVMVGRCMARRDMDRRRMAATGFGFRIGALVLGPLVLGPLE
jgi:hypothetical protein